jgi:tetratricopeptide (TPR) repeat protein
MINWERDCKRFASISALAGIPEVVIPINLDDGSCLGIGILAMQRKDSVLLRAVGKISQYIQEERKKQTKPVQATKPDAKKKVENEVTMAEEEKNLGNACFKMQKFEQAIQHYSRAVQLDAKNPVFLSNRAMAYLKLGAYVEAEEDCTKALEMDPCLVKVFLRRGAARAATARFAEAKSDFERVNSVVVVPNNPLSAEPIVQAYVMSLNVPSIQRYGLRILQGNTVYTNDTKLNLKKTATKTVSLLTDWFFTAHMLYDGTIVTDGTNEFVEIGHNLYIEDVNQLYHIEGISYTYEIDPETGSTIYNTEFRVSRGQLVDDTLSKSDFIGRALTLTEIPEKEGVTVMSNTIENIRNSDSKKRGK